MPPDAHAARALNQIVREPHKPDQNDRDKHDIKHLHDDVACHAKPAKHDREHPTKNSDDRADDDQPYQQIHEESRAKTTHDQCPLCVSISAFMSASCPARSSRSPSSERLPTTPMRSFSSTVCDVKPATLAERSRISCPSKPSSVVIRFSSTFCDSCSCDRMTLCS